MSVLRLNRTAFKAQSFAEAADHAPYYKKLSWQERLVVAGYLNAIAYNFDPERPPVMNRLVFSTRSLKNGKFI